MLLLLTDEDFDGRIIRGLLRRRSDIRLVRAQDVGLLGASDDKLLEWASENNRIVLTHDRRTMPRHVADRLESGFPVPGVVVVDHRASIGRCIDDLLLIIECSEQPEWADRVYY